MGTAARATARKPRRFWRVVKWVLLGLAILLVVACVAGVTYQAIANYRDGQRFPQEGRSVPLGAAFPGVSLSINCTGQSVPGAPTVVLDAGLGGPAASWDLVQPGVAKFARVCSYDRAGYGWSTPGPMPRTSGEIAKELHALLEAAEEKPPYVLVAHSFAGFNVRVYTNDYPAEVAGMVLVDTSHEDINQRAPSALKTLMAKQQEQLETLRRFGPYLLFFGIARMMGPLKDPSGRFPKEFVEKMNYLVLQSKFLEAIASEFGNFDTSAAEAKAAGNLGDRPLVVLTAGKMEDLKQLPKGIEQKDLDDLHTLWVNDLQVQEMHLSTRGTRRIVEDSTHLIPVERPDAVVAAIRDVCDAVKAGPPATAAARHAP